MKIKIALVSLVGVLLGTYVLAASLSLSPLSVNTKKGQEFNVAITLNPQGKIYSANVALKFPSDLVEVKQGSSQSFVLGAGWISPEGAKVNNSAGTVSMLAGYPKGTDVASLFGTVTFVAKKDGSGTISVDGSSVALGADNKNALSGTFAPVNVSIITPVATTTPSPTATPEVTTVSATVRPGVTASVTVAPTETSVVAATTTEESANKANGLLATIGSITSLGTGKGWVTLIVLVVVILIVRWAYYAIRRRKGGQIS